MLCRLLLLLFCFWCLPFCLFVVVFKGCGERDGRVCWEGVPCAPVLVQLASCGKSGSGWRWLGPVDLYQTLHGCKSDSPEKPCWVGLRIAQIRFELQRIRYHDSNVSQLQIRFVLLRIPSADTDYFSELELALLCLNYHEISPTNNKHRPILTDTNTSQGDDGEMSKSGLSKSESEDEFGPQRVVCSPSNCARRAFKKLAVHQLTVWTRLAQWMSFASHQFRCRCRTVYIVTVTKSTCFRSQSNRIAAKLFKSFEVHYIDCAIGLPVVALQPRQRPREAR